MIHGIARAMQFLGLLILPIAISGNLANRLNLKESLEMSTVGILVFFGGWLLQQSTRRQ